jgi:hypothetical protein
MRRVLSVPPLSCTNRSSATHISTDIPFLGRAVRNTGTNCSAGNLTDNDSTYADPIFHVNRVANHRSNYHIANHRSENTTDSPTSLAPHFPEPDFLADKSELR